MTPTGISLDSIIICDDLYDQVAPSVSFGDNIYLVSWCDKRGEFPAIYCARLLPDGSVLDEDGFSYVRDSITRATKEGVWTNSKIKGSFQSTFSQKIDLGIARYVVTCSYYPVSKPESMTLLVQSAASYLKTNPRAKAFGEFVNPEGRFRRGDLKLIVVDTMGLCYAYGDDVDLIWRNIFKAKDDDGRPFIQLFINEAQRGPSVVKTKLNHAEKTNFVFQFS